MSELRFFTVPKVFRFMVVSSAIFAAVHLQERAADVRACPDALVQETLDHLNGPQAMSALGQLETRLESLARDHGTDVRRHVAVIHALREQSLQARLRGSYVTNIRSDAVH